MKRRLMELSVGLLMALVFGIIILRQKMTGRY